MKNRYTLIAALLLSIFSQAQDIQWERTLGGKHADYLNDAIPTLDYGFILVGGSLSNKTGDVQANAGDFDFLISKISENGDLEWTKTLGGEKTDRIQAISNSADGGYLLAGISNSKPSNSKTSEYIGQEDVWLVKLNIKGAVSWQKTLGGADNDKVVDIVRTKDTGYLIAVSSASGSSSASEGSTAIHKTSANRGSLDYWLVKIAADGTLQWQKSFGGRYRDALAKVIELQDGSIVLGGTSNSPAGFDKHTEHYGLSDWWLLKLNADGEELWQTALGNEGNDVLSSLIETQDGNILAGGSFGETGRDADADIKLIKLDLDGETIWEQDYDESHTDILVDILQNDDGSLLLSGYATGKKTPNKKMLKTPKGTEDYLVIKTDAKGEELWHDNYGNNSKEVLRKSILTRDGGYVLLGTRMPLVAEKHNDANFWLVKLLDKDKPEYVKKPLEAIPNPTANFTQIVLADAYEKGTVQVVDIAGKVVQQFTITGKRLIVVDMSQLATGVYIVHVATDVANNSVKVIKR